jgi:YVTN family beta-propeller protein
MSQQALDKFRPRPIMMRLGGAMKYAFVLFALGCLVTAVSAQWLEATIAVGGGPSELMYVPSVNKLYCANDDPPSISIIDCATNTVRATIPDFYYCLPLGWSDAYQRVYVGTQADSRKGDAGSSIIVIDAVNDVVVARLPCDDYPCSAAYCRTLDKLYVMCNGDVSGVEIIDAARDSIVGHISMPMYPEGIGWCPATNTVFLANDRGDSMRVIDCSTDQVRALREGYSAFDEVCWNRVDGRVYTSGEYALNAFDATGDSLVYSISHPEYTPTVCFASYPNKCFVGDFNTGRIYVVDCNARSIVDSVQTDQVCAMVLDSIGGRVYVAHPRDAVTVLDAHSNSVVRTVPVTQYPSGTIAWASRERRIYVPGYYTDSLYVIRDTTVGVAEAPRPQAVSRRPAATVLSGAGVQCLASKVVFDPMGRRVANPKPGVYFVPETQGQAQAQAVRKVLITK